MKYIHVISEVMSTPWSILPEKLAEILAFLRLKANGGEVSVEDIDAIKQPKGVPLFFEIEPAAQPPMPDPSKMPQPMMPMARAGSVAVLPLFGTISNRMNMMTDLSGGTSTEQFTNWFRAALNDPNVRAILLDVNSPGGTVKGVPELADEIFQARGVKPIIAQVNATAASAAYWLATQADELVVTPSGEVGSIGVFAAHEDCSKMMEMNGLDVTLVSAGKYKTEGNPFEPLNEEAKQALQEKVNSYYDSFVKAVARGRGTTPAAVRNGFGEGRTVQASQAMDMGMADRVATMSQTMERMGVPQQKKKMMNAEMETPTVRTEKTSDLEFRRKKLVIL